MENLGNDLELKLSAIQKELNDSQWYLGEEKAKCLRLESSLTSAQQKCTELESVLNQLKAQYAALQKELADAQWYLGEERAKNKS